jgi:plasmid stabilization system protein ParE
MYDVSVAAAARRDFRDLIEWLSAANPAVASRVSNDLRMVSMLDLEQNPNRYAYFWLTGPPYRGRLFQISRNTKYWIVYRVNESERHVDVLRLWNASRNPSAFEL